VLGSDEEQGGCPDPSFERPDGGDADRPRPEKRSDSLYAPTEHTETVDPGVCRLLVALGAGCCILGIFLPSCLGAPLIVGGGVLGGVAHAFRERRYSHLVMWLAVAALLLHGAATMVRGCVRGGHGVVGTDERYMNEE